MGVRTRLGLTIGEVLVAAGISLFLAGVILRIFIPALAYSAEARTRLELQQYAALAFQQMQNEVLRTRATGVSVADSSLLLHPQVALDAQGEAIWDNHTVLFFLDDTENKLGRYHLPSSLSQPTRYTPAELPAQTATLPPVRKVVAGFVREFRVQFPVPASASDPPSPLTLELIMTKDVPRRDAPVTLSLKRRFAFRTNE